jgi:hypothetical protein
MSQNVISKSRQGGRRKLPLVFTEQGIAMLSSVLRSRRAAQVNVAIMRTFVKLRELLVTHRDLVLKAEEHDQKITALIETVQRLLTLPPVPPKKRIGFVAPHA